ncbi:D-glucuronyl C5-epimerase family protein [uncultured Cohaesibacter sp.]|uniref:D-glucuronyl C5-epimerase family protein n=1 Tax=uncultured Cohaesibacter sp. TaxID=1002546 RepID=UPI0029C74F83|nr:D-glucuronyl C5-epimerase family protein [uncultured Cohaesibacter sp.]
MNDVFSLQGAVTLTPVQPPQKLRAKIARCVKVGTKDVYSHGDIDRTMLVYHPKAAVIKDWLPYYEYYALKTKSKHVIHPMAMGRYLKENALAPVSGEIVEAVLSISRKLPNGGLAWYYPPHYNVSRMLGGKLKYSSISQGTIIAGLTEMAKQGVVDQSLPRRAFDALLWPFEKGGVNLANKAVLEMPSFAGPPEIILNGWIDAIIHINDYATWSNDDDAREFAKDNVLFLSQIIQNFDCGEMGISRYSDLCPYRTKIYLASPDDVPSLQILYRPKFDGLPTIKVIPQFTQDPDSFSAYDNQIFRQNGKIAHVWLSMSQLYETFVCSSSKQMRLTVSIGELNRTSTGPGLGGELKEYESTEFDGGRYVHLPHDDGFVCGYPTNFSKGGTHNYYHAYHVVGVLLLAFADLVGPEQKLKLIRWALKWRDDYDRIIREEELSFRPLQDMLSDINANKSSIEFPDYQNLELLARQSIAAASPA